MLDDLLKDNYRCTNFQPERKQRQSSAVLEWHEQFQIHDSSTWNKPDMSLWQSWSSMLLHWSSIKIHNPRFMLPFCNSQIQETKTLCHQTQSYIIWSSSSSSSSYGRNWKFTWRDSQVFKLTLPFCNCQIQETKTIHNKTWSYNCTSELKIQGRKKNHVSHDLTIVEACH
jgi:predicted SprT family Zn-dependent metalloprotease